MCSYSFAEKKIMPEDDHAEQWSWNFINSAEMDRD
jgi:hypothetical protein